MKTEDCQDLLSIVLSFITLFNTQPTGDDDIPDLFDLLSYLEPEEKRTFWDYMGTHALNTRKWLAKNKPA